ncbi:hypothetical protein [Streptomyces bluensis]|uniref:hypothetical protein n=1 Tax=Streptomyces bluensis TaxID=33897 RepID=UPI001673026E|nr:hypothetical protein [Streptomyces bluensis]GGZ40294.1 hypothetical protein GCM10010344_00970 [Streptomyces bluensis]
MLVYREGTRRAVAWKNVRAVGGKLRLKHPSAAGYVSLTDSMGGTTKQTIYRAYRIVI